MCPAKTQCSATDDGERCSNDQNCGETALSKQPRAQYGCQSDARYVNNRKCRQYGLHLQYRYPNEKAENEKTQGNIS